MDIAETLGSTFYKNLLSQQARTYYDEIYANLIRREYSGVILFKAPLMGAADEVFSAYKAFKDDHPECFWLGGESELCQYGSWRAEISRPIFTKSN